MLDAARAGVQASFAVVGYKGRAWSLKHRGENTLVRDAKGAPVPTLEIVIVGVAPAVSKIYYQKAYVEGDDNAPDCFSIDGVAPDNASPKKQNDICATCRHNQWGSRVTDAGKRAKSCQDSRRIAIVPLGDILNKTLGGPMLLRVPPTSLPNLASYSDLLERKGADFPYVATVLGFDYAVAYPKLTFEAAGFLNDEQARQVLEVIDDPLIGRMLFEAAPTESAAAPAAGGEAEEEEHPLEGKLAAAFQQPRPETVVNLPTRQQAQTTNPFFGGLGNGSAAPAPAPEPEPEPAVAGETQAAPRGRRRAAAAAPAAAPASLESALQDLLDDEAESA